MSTTPNPTAGSPSLKGVGNLEEKGHDLGQQADAAVSRVQARAEEAASGWRETGTHVKEKWTAAKDRVAHGVQNGRDRVTHEVQDHPVRTLLYAFGAGVLAGLLMRRRRHRGD